MSIVSLIWLPVSAILYVFGWFLVHPMVAAHTKGRKFLEITQLHCFYKQKYSKNKKPSSRIILWKNSAWETY